MENNNQVPADPDRLGHVGNVLPLLSVLLADKAAGVLYDPDGVEVRRSRRKSSRNAAHFNVNVEAGAACRPR
ncbi:hypothetical protein P3T76_013976 [Phytophthora citrophthora]|uniref:Uncharacterized protein n=1 Tax=Phytophthora citrophthora TaxID=4793 RepID=A0AAD9G2X1_9STRA|nr:hypothetical protein P3T76_013976 [Phytophthora citrophthora]